MAKTWAELVEGRVLIAATRSEEWMTGVRSPPFARVAKYEQDRSLSADERFVHDQRVVNLGTCRWDAPTVPGSGS